MIIPVILSGGNGTRLWPISKKDRPKQFIKLLNNKTLFSQTIERFKNKSLFKEPIILGNIKHEKLIDKEIQKNNLTKSKIILEPKARNTAPAIASVIELLMDEKNNNEIVVFVSSDAYINNIEDFQNYLIEGKKIAEDNKMVCFGAKPTYAETGYGYIELGKKIKNNSYIVNKFVEKPNLQKAIEFLDSGRYLWNVGIFMCKVSILHKLFEKYQNDLLYNIKLTISNSVKKENKIYLDKKIFENLEEISIDYAIMEKLDSTNLAIVSMNLIWSDIGSFQALYNINSHKTQDNNVLNGKNVLHNTTNCFISSNRKIICCSDIDDLVIIEDGDVVLIMKKNKSQNIKKLLEECKEKDLENIL